MMVLCLHHQYYKEKIQVVKPLEYILEPKDQLLNPWSRFWVKKTFEIKFCTAQEQSSPQYYKSYCDGTVYKES